MADNIQNPSGARSASEALSKMKENRQRPSTIAQSTQTSKPHITHNTVPRNNNTNNKSKKSGCGWVVWFAVAIVITYLIFSMF